ncbi:MAG: prolyl oligopeptidase family serine peptidase [Myxococcota bacterium]
MSPAALLPLLTAVVLHPVRGWPAAVREITYLSPVDHTAQPALFYAPPTRTPRPLLVVLHTWSRDHRHPNSAPFAQWCVDKRWVMVHPNFRGPNHGPHALGSEAAIQDILAAVSYARTHANVDARRIYLVGWSGGGHASLLVAARAPQLWAGVSAWVPVTDLAAWYFQTRGTPHTHYAEDIRAACGGVPFVGSDAAEECARRSPLGLLRQARGVPLDLNAGIHDGHHRDGKVPISHTLAAYNQLAHPRHRITARQARELVERSRVPGKLRYRGRDRHYGDNPVLVRRQSGAVRLTIFEGGHLIRRSAALHWLSKQRKRAPPPPDPA